MSRRHTRWAETQDAGSRGTNHLLAVLAWLAFDDGRLCHSRGKIAAKARCSEKTVQRGLRVLEARGLIRREPRYREDGSRSTDIITLAMASEVPTTVPAERKAGVGGPECPEGGDRMSPLTTFEPTLEPSDPEGSALNGVKHRNDRRALFERGPGIVQRLTGRSHRSCRALIGRWLGRAGEDAATLSRILDEAAKAEPAEAVSWVEGALTRARCGTRTAMGGRSKLQPDAGGTPIADPDGRQAEAQRMVERGEWPVGGTVPVLAGTSQGGAWECYFAEFGRRPRWRDLGRDGWGWHMPSPWPPARPVPALA